MGRFEFSRTGEPLTPMTAMVSCVHEEEDQEEVEERARRERGCQVDCISGYAGQAARDVERGQAEVLTVGNGAATDHSMTVLGLQAVGDVRAASKGNGLRLSAYVPGRHKTQAGALPAVPLLRPTRSWPQM